MLGLMDIVHDISELWVSAEDVMLRQVGRPYSKAAMPRVNWLQ